MIHPLNRSPLLPCEGSCIGATRHTYDKELSLVPVRNGVGNYHRYIFQCTDCRQRRVWGNVDPKARARK